ncbi:MAG: ABC transporter [Anaerolineae bacterium UTCFX2]|jgi:ATP-binding cassette subfamily B protein|nr:ABC transporter ATP-binding protein/permease [Anaerolineales bacterium]OQY93164.1 MAG: ABC transporter [Anaerolineae bacterium UTCFX2]
MTAQFYEEEEFTTQFNGKTVLRILAQTRQHWIWVVGFVAAIVITSVLDGYLTYLGKQIVDLGIMANNKQVLIEIVIKYALLVLVQGVTVLGFVFLASVLGERVRYDLRKKLVNNLQDLSLSYYSHTPVGWIMSRVTSDTERVSDLVTWGLVDVCWATANIFTSAFFMLKINWRLGLFVLAILPFISWVAIQFRKKILVEFRRARKTNSKITGAYNENITGVRVVKALGRENENIQEFHALTSEMYRASYRAAWLSALFLPTVQIIGAFALGAVAWYGGLSVEVGGMTIGGIQAFVSYILFMTWPIQDLARVYAEMQQSIASAERMFSLIDAVPELQDRPDSFDPGDLRGDIVFNHVDFYYEPEKPVLTDFNLQVRHGETIALVGPTGGGKTTIVNLICRFYEPKKGRILIDGVDYTHLTQHSIQSRIGIVLQTPHLFSGSVRENIRYGRLDATDQEVEEAARLAGAHEFIARLDDGYLQDVGESGNLLSTGQKQLISLARAVLARPQIFIMDEATSSVDTLTEALIQKGMENLMQGRTSFIIAHRLSTIRRADRIIYIENGRIAEMGAHNELLRQRGPYFNLYTRQFRRELAQEYDLFRLDGLAPL